MLTFLSIAARFAGFRKKFFFRAAPGQQKNAKKPCF